MADPSRQIVSIDMSQLTQFAKELKAAAPTIRAKVWKTLSTWGAEYHRRVQRVTPVGPTTEDRIGGTARKSWVLVRDRNDKEMSVTIGSSVKSDDGKPYLVYLEYGTDRIAGGRVKAWKPGDAPIMDWPAKDVEMPSMLSARPGSAKFERAVSVAQHAYSPGTGEQMPMLRPIGHEIAPQVAADIKEAMIDGFIETLVRRKKSNGLQQEG